MKLTIDQMVAMRREGGSLRDISRAARINHAAVKRLLVEAMGEEDALRPFWTGRRDARLIALVGAEPALTWDAIADAMGVMKGTAQARAKALGLVKRRVVSGPQMGSKYTPQEPAVAALPEPEPVPAADDPMRGLRFGVDPRAERAVHGRGRVHLPATVVPTRTIGAW